MDLNLINYVKMSTISKLIERYALLDNQLQSSKNTRRSKYDSREQLIEQKKHEIHRRNLKYEFHNLAREVARAIEWREIGNRKLKIDGPPNAPKTNIIYHDAFSFDKKFIPKQPNKYSRQEEVLIEYEEMFTKLQELLRRKEAIRDDLSLDGKERMELIEFEKRKNQEFMQQFIEKKIQLMSELEWFYTERYRLKLRMGSTFNTPIIERV